MIEFFTRRRLILAIVLLSVLSICVVVIENEWTPKEHTEYSNSFSANQSDICPNHEEYTILESCKKCSDLEIKSGSIKACEVGSYRQKIKCKESGPIYKRCESNEVLIQEHKFIVFQTIMLCVGIVSGLCSYKREVVLYRRILNRIQRQIASNV